MSGHMPTPTGMDRSAVIDKDVLCIGCGYNLRGLTIEEVCPECATPLARSLHGNLLRYADPAWLRKIRLGVMVMLWNLLIDVLLVAAIMLLSTLGWPAILHGGLVLVGAAMSLLATLLVTAQEPRISVIEDAMTLRRVVRACAITTFVGAICSQAGTILGFGSAIRVCAAVLALVGIVAYFGKFIYLRRFAGRIPDNKLARSTTAVMWGFVIAYAATVVSRLIAVILAVSTTGGMLRNILLVLIIVGNVGVLVFGVAYIILLFRFNAALRKTCDQAQPLAKHKEPALTTIHMGKASPASLSGGSGLLRPTTPTNPRPLSSPAAAPPRSRGDDLVARLTTALWREPTSPQAHYDLAVALVGRGRLREATQQYQEAIHIRPDYVEAHLNLANCLLRQHQSDEAVLHLQRALQVRPNFPTAHYNLANILFRQGRADEAIRHYSTAVQVKPDFAPARHNLAVALLRQGRHDEAVEHLRAALQLEPDNSRIHRELEAAQTRHSPPAAL